MHDIIVEVSGGTVVGVYTSLPDARVVLVDWDEVDCGEHAGEYPASAIEDMSERTQREYGYAQLNPA